MLISVISKKITLNQEEIILLGLGWVWGISLSATFHLA